MLSIFVELRRRALESSRKASRLCEWPDSPVLGRGGLQGWKPKQLNVDRESEAARF